MLSRKQIYCKGPAVTHTHRDTHEVTVTNQIEVCLVIKITVVEVFYENNTNVKTNHQVALISDLYPMYDFAKNTKTEQISKTFFVPRAIAKSTTMTHNAKSITNK